MDVVWFEVVVLEVERVRLKGVRGVCHCLPVWRGES